MESYTIYGLFTKHWPKFATGIVVTIGLFEFFLSTYSTDSSLEWYFLAWGGFTGGIWFLFDIAEKSTPTKTRDQLSQWVKTTEFRPQFEALPARFTALFDLIFGGNHFSFFCFRRSVVVSIIASWFVTTVVYSIDPMLINTMFGQESISSPFDTLAVLGSLGVVALVTNLIPDYLSLLQTRFMLDLAEGGKKLAWVLVFDTLATAAIFLIYMSALFGILAFVGAQALVGDELEITSAAFWIYYSATYIELLSELMSAFVFGSSSPVLNVIVVISFITTFFTSIWLWLYMLTALASQLLLQLNSKVGFLITVVDVDSQPFRSLGFVAVLIVTIIFTLGLPFVL